MCRACDSEFAHTFFFYEVVGKSDFQDFAVRTANFAVEKPSVGKFGVESAWMTIAEM